MEGGKMSYQETNKNEVVYMFTAWLEKLLHNAKLDYIKQEKKHLHVISLDVIPEYYLSCEPSTNSKFETFENKLLKEAFLSLTDLRKNVIYLYFFEALTIDEIAVLLDLNVKNVRRIKERAISKLRSILLNGDENE